MYADSVPLAWRCYGGLWGRSAAKLRLYQKIWKVKKYFEGENFRKGLHRRKIERVQKKVVKKFWGMRQKCRGAASLRSAPGGRHPSYATAMLM